MNKSGLLPLRFSLILVSVISICCASQVQAQVTSAAGLHYLSSMQRLENRDGVTANTIHAGFLMALPNNNRQWIGSQSAQIEYSRQWTQRLSTDVRISGYARSHILDPTVRNLGDLFLIGSYRLLPRLAVHGGFKFPLNHDNHKSSFGATLPLSIQPSSGAYDLIAGLSFRLWWLEIFSAWQKPLTRSDFNYSSEYFNSMWCGNSFDSSTPDAKKRYRRAGQFFLRIKAPITLGERWVLSPALAALGAFQPNRDLHALVRELEKHYVHPWAVGTLDLDVRLYRKLHAQWSIGVPLEMLDCNSWKYLFGGIELRQHF